VATGLLDVLVVKLRLEEQSHTETIVVDRGGTEVAVGVVPEMVKGPVREEVGEKPVGVSSTGEAVVSTPVPVTVVHELVVFPMSALQAIAVYV